MTTIQLQIKGQLYLVKVRNEFLDDFVSSLDKQIGSNSNSLNAWCYKEEDDSTFTRLAYAERDLEAFMVLK